jgi:cyclohexadienyl dehydratase
MLATKIPFPEPHRPSRALRRLLTGIMVGWCLVAPRLPAQSRFAGEAEGIECVIDLIDRRLAIMPEVAAGKFRDQKPITDPVREREVIAQSVADAEAIHLDGEAARDFFTVQISLARAVQSHLFARWRDRRETPPPSRSLTAVIRPELDAIGRELLPAVYRASAALVATPVRDLQQRVARLQRHPGLTPELLAPLGPALARLRLTAPATWAVLQRVGCVRVATTGDYAPFSADGGNELRGLDIELAGALARSWGLNVVFVRTTWPALLDDLAQRRFDLALSGITITPERRTRADFSLPYYIDGKTPIARRERADNFSSLENIDQPGVRIIVNPGGTNERFVRAQIKHAEIIVYPDNRTIFQEIIAGHADVMITDGVEVRMQTQLHPELRATMAVPFTRAGKAVLLPRDSELTGRVDSWLAPQVERGVIAAWIENHLAQTGVAAAPPAGPTPAR